MDVPARNNILPRTGPLVAVVHIRHQGTRFLLEGNMIIYPEKQYNPMTGAESWVNPTPFILEERDLGIVHDVKEELFGEEISGMEIYDFMRKSAAIGMRIDRGQLNNC